MVEISIVIPCYNEEKRLPVDEFRQFLSTRTMKIVFVNDGSTDGTLEVLKELRSTFPAKVTLVNLERNVGKAAAVREGILQCIRVNQPDVVGFMDADLSTPLPETRLFLHTFRRSKFEFVFGSRIARIGANIHRFHHRHYLGRVIASLISIYLGIPVYDSQCGAKFFRVGLARELFREPFVSNWLFDVEIFKRIALSGRDVNTCSLEMPLTTWIEKGQSKLGLKSILRLPVEFGRIVLRYRGGIRPSEVNSQCVSHVLDMPDAILDHETPSKPGYTSSLVE